MLRRVLRQVGTVLLWIGVVLLGAFGAVFSFANYPLFAVGTVLLLVLLILLLVAQWERTRRRRDSVRERDRIRRRNLSREEAESMGRPGSNA